jgi:hypothetical protein
LGGRAPVQAMLGLKYPPGELPSQFGVTIVGGEVDSHATRSPRQVNREATKTGCSNILQPNCLLESGRLATCQARARDGDKPNLCGITGFTHRDGVFDPARIRTATDSLIHRGPDQQGTYESEQISLGAVRLKIIDLQTGEQPLFSGDRNTALVFNGEIYNYRQLRAELESRGHQFKTRSDTEVVLQAFLQWDTD